VVESSLSVSIGQGRILNVYFKKSARVGGAFNEMLPYSSIAKWKDA